jgi:hypothetical protein
LTLLMEPRYLVEAKYVTHEEQRAVVSVCTNLWIKETELSINIANTRNYPLLVEVNLKGLEGIVGLLEDQSLNWGIDAFRCDNDLKNIESSVLPASQGERIRICMVPNEVTLKDGVYIAGISSFTFNRGDHIQTAVTGGQASGDGGTTQIYCPRGSDICAIDTVLSTNFFHSPGEVIGSGTVFLQFGYTAPAAERSLLRKRVELDIQWSPTTDTNRALYEIGESVGETGISYNVQIEPSTSTFQAEAFRCNHLNEPVTGDASPVQFGESIRICIQPDKQAQQTNVFISKIGSFYFTKGGDRRQDALDADGRPVDDGRTLVICSRGSTMCSIKTDLQSWFFFKRGTAEVTGDVYLQFGSQRVVRRAQIVYRYLQDQEGESDPGSAGLSVVSAPFSVAYSAEAGSGPDWWNSAPAWQKALIALALGALILILCCCICACMFYSRRRIKTKTFIMKTVLDVDVKPERDDSVDARFDSKASFYSDLEFDTDASGNSSDEESITERFEEDLEDNVCAILFPQNPNPDDLSTSLGKPAGQRQSMPVSNFQGTGMSPPRSSSLPGRRPVDPLSMSAHAKMNRGGSPGRRPARGVDPLSMSEHSARVGNYPPPGLFPRRMSEQGPTAYMHPPPLGLRPPPRTSHAGMVDRLSQSEHSSYGRHYPPGAPHMLRPPYPAYDMSQMQSMQLPRRIPKGRKASYNGGYHPDGITQIPRVETLGATPVGAAKAGKKKGVGKKKAGKKKNGKNGKGKKNNNGPNAETNSIGSGGTKKKNKASNNGVKKSENAKPAASGSTCGNSGSTGKTAVCSDDDDLTTPQNEDICFEAEDHPGTKEFLNATRSTLKQFGPSAYSPKIYKHIKRQLPDRRFFVCDDDDKPFEWREVTKSELIDLVWKYYEEVKSQMFGVSIEEEDASEEEAVES